MGAAELLRGTVGPTLTNRGGVFCGAQRATVRSRVSVRKQGYRKDNGGTRSVTSPEVMNLTVTMHRRADHDRNWPSPRAPYRRP